MAAIPPCIVYHCFNPWEESATSRGIMHHQPRGGAHEKQKLMDGFRSARRRRRGRRVHRRTASSTTTSAWTAPARTTGRGTTASRTPRRRATATRSTRRHRHRDSRSSPRFSTPSRIAAPRRMATPPRHPMACARCRCRSPIINPRPIHRPPRRE